MGTSHHDVIQRPRAVRISPVNRLVRETRAELCQNPQPIHNAIIESERLMIFSHVQNAESSGALSLLIASDVQVVAERGSQHSFQVPSRRKETK